MTAYSRLTQDSNVFLPHCYHRESSFLSNDMNPMRMKRIISSLKNFVKQIKQIANFHRVNFYLNDEYLPK